MDGLVTLVLEYYLQYYDLRFKRYHMRYRQQKKRTNGSAHLWYRPLKFDTDGIEILSSPQIFISFMFFFRVASRNSFKMRHSISWTKYVHKWLLPQESEPTQEVWDPCLRVYLPHPYGPPRKLSSTPHFSHEWFHTRVMYTRVSLQEEYVEHDPKCRRRLAGPRVRDDFAGIPKTEILGATQTGKAYGNHGKVPREKSLKPYRFYIEPTILMDLESTQRSDYIGN